MFQVQNITQDAFQKQTMILPDGSSLVLTIYFRPLQQGWFLENITHNDFSLNGLRITNSPNMLHQFKNQINFGLACFSMNDREPSLPQDFSSGASVLYVLTEDEVNAYTEFLSGSN